MNPVELVRRWLAVINARDARPLAPLMAEDFVFVDSLGNRTSGAAAMTAGWQAYFAMCPDYWIRADDIAPLGDIILLTGEAGGTIDGIGWRIPAAWKAIVSDGKLVEWRVFADNKPVYDILARRPR